MSDRIEGHIFKRYDGELGHLHYLVLEMGGLVLKQVADSLTAFKDRDLDLAQKIVFRDGEVDRLERDADVEVIRVIAKNCPVSGDLRMVLAVSKSVSDLERIGDEAVRIAGLVHQIFGGERGDPSEEFVRDVHGMGELALRILREALDLFDAWHEEKAEQVIECQRELESEFQADLRRLMTYVLEDARTIGTAISVMLVIKSLERIGHYGRNLAEYIAFQVIPGEGEVSSGTLG
jgi:phosphate transport system protein